MGEYATLKSTGERIKIGTCEDMYYLRADQVRLVRAEHGNVDPVRDAAEIRFRFPFPSEDGIPPGSFENPEKGLRVYGVEPPAELEHYSCQFAATNGNGYLVSLPCPESDAAVYRLGRCEPGANNGLHKLTVHRNGYGGAVEIVQQGLRDGVMALICRCKGCGAKYRYPTFDDVRPILEALANENGNDEIARRIESGYLPAGLAATFANAAC